MAEIQRRVERAVAQVGEEHAQRLAEKWLAIGSHWPAALRRNSNRPLRVPT